jgi:Ca2+-binding RTX toxin-like protein
LTINYTSADGDITTTGEGLEDELNFLSGYPLSFNSSEFTYQKLGNDLVIVTRSGGTAGGTITIENHFVNDIFRFETLIFSSFFGTERRLNLLFGTDNNDQIIGSSGTDFINGLDGDDLISGLDRSDIVDGGNGIDIVDYSGFASAVFLDLLHDDYYGENVTRSLQNIEGFIGTNYFDELIGDDSVNIIRGLDGQDTIRGFGGDDLLEGGQDKDYIRGDAGEDRIYGGENSDRLYGGTGNDLIYCDDGDDINVRGDEGDDKLYGGNGNDKLYGDDKEGIIVGNDLLDGGNGDDDLRGGLGDDTYRASAGQDYIYDIGGFDRLIFGEQTSIYDLRFQRDAVDTNDQIIIDGANQIHIENQTDFSGHYAIESLVFTDGSSADFTTILDWVFASDSGEIINGSYHRNDTIIGGDGDDRLYGKDGDDFLFGGRGHDNLRGDKGNDVLHGGLGDDILRGYEGDDSLFAGDGKNRLEGHQGADMFIFFGPEIVDSQMDRIVDFSHDEGDKIILDHVLDGYDPLNDTILDFISLHTTTHTYLDIDIDGKNSQYASVANVIRIELTGGDWTDAQELIDNGDLIIL